MAQDHSNLTISLYNNDYHFIITKYGIADIETDTFLFSTEP